MSLPQAPARRARRRRAVLHVPPATRTRRPATPRSTARGRPGPPTPSTSGSPTSAGKRLQVVFTSTGSAQGRQDFAYKTTDFGVSDIAYQGTDPVTAASRTTRSGRKFAYLPIVAGGTSFPYNLSYARPAHPQPAAVRRDARQDLHQPDPRTGTTRRSRPTTTTSCCCRTSRSSRSCTRRARARRTSSPRTWPSSTARIWSGFTGSRTPTEYFPRSGNQQAQNGSDGVMNFITSSAGNGAIGFDEYSYALARTSRWPRCSTRPATTPRRPSTTSPSR